MRFDDQTLKDLNEKYLEVTQITRKLIDRLVVVASKLRDPKAKEYMWHGVLRRLGILNRCIENVFTLFPPENRDRLSDETIKDVEINLHAFFVNVAGVFDNLAWVFVMENGLFGTRQEGKLEKPDVGLFLKRTQRYLPQLLREHLTAAKIAKCTQLIQKSIVTRSRTGSLSIFRAH